MKSIKDRDPLCYYLVKLVDFANLSDRFLICQYNDIKFTNRCSSPKCYYKGKLVKCDIIMKNENLNYLQKQRENLADDYTRELERKVYENCQDGLQVRFNEKGRAIYAEKDFETGEFVVEYKGDLISRSEGIKREKESLSDQCYLYFFNFNNKNYCVDATEETDFYGRLINHSCDGNVKAKVLLLNQRITLICVATKPIKIGDEILYDYGDQRPKVRKYFSWLRSDHNAGQDNQTKLKKANKQSKEDDFEKINTKINEINNRLYIMSHERLLLITRLLEIDYSNAAFKTGKCTKRLGSSSTTNETKQILDSVVSEELIYGLEIELIELHKAVTLSSLHQLPEKTIILGLLNSILRNIHMDTSQLSDNHISEIAKDVSSELNQLLLILKKIRAPVDESESYRYMFKNSEEVIINFLKYTEDVLWALKNTNKKYKDTSITMKVFHSLQESLCSSSFEKEKTKAINNVIHKIFESEQFLLLNNRDSLTNNVTQALILVMMSSSKIVYDINSLSDLQASCVEFHHILLSLIDILVELLPQVSDESDLILDYLQNICLKATAFLSTLKLAVDDFNTSNFLKLTAEYRMLISTTDYYMDKVQYNDVQTIISIYQDRTQQLLKVSCADYVMSVLEKAKESQEKLACIANLKQSAHKKCMKAIEDFSMTVIELIDKKAQHVSDLVSDIRQTVFYSDDIPQIAVNESEQFTQSCTTVEKLAKNVLLHNSDDCSVIQLNENDQQDGPESIKINPVVTNPVMESSMDEAMESSMDKAMESSISNFEPDNVSLGNVINSYRIDTNDSDDEVFFGFSNPCAYLNRLQALPYAEFEIVSTTKETATIEETSKAHDSPKETSTPIGRSRRTLWKVSTNEDSLKSLSDETMETSVLEQENITEKRKQRRDLDTDRERIKNGGGYCTYCTQPKVVSQYAKHLEKKHSNKPEIAPICRMPKHSTERRNAIGKLRNKGLATFNDTYKETIPLRHRNEQRTDKVQCETCKSWLSRKTLWNHKKKWNHQ